MGVPEIQNCCGFSLKHGTALIGAIGSIMGFMFLILCAAYAEHPNELIQMSDPTLIPKLETLKTTLKVMAAISAMQCVFSIMLVFGAALNHPGLLTPWLILNPIGLIVFVLLMLMLTIHYTGVYSVAFILGHIIGYFIVAMLLFYQILAVHSYREYLKRLNF